MPNYERSFRVAIPADRAFAFVSDFRNAARWDPRTKSVRKATPGPIAKGTTFVLRGGAANINLDLPYTIETFEPEKQLLLTGETRVFRYDDQVDFRPVDGETEVTWRAMLEFKRPLQLGNPLLALMFRRIGDDATYGLEACLRNLATSNEAELADG